MKQTTEELIHTPLIRCEAQLVTWPTGKIGVDLRWTLGAFRDDRCIGVSADEYNVSPAALDCLAEQFKLASIQLYALAAELDPGRAFAENQAIAFGAERLEGDLPRVED